MFLADREGNEITADTLGPGQYFGEMALEGEPSSASVITTIALWDLMCPGKQPQLSSSFSGRNPGRPS